MVVERKKRNVSTRMNIVRIREAILEGNRYKILSSKGKEIMREADFEEPVMKEKAMGSQAIKIGSNEKIRKVHSGKVFKDPNVNVINLQDKKVLHYNKPINFTKIHEVVSSGLTHRNGNASRHEGLDVMEAASGNQRQDGMLNKTVVLLPMDLYSSHGVLHEPDISTRVKEGVAGSGAGALEEVVVETQCLSMKEGNPSHLQGHH